MPGESFFKRWDLGLGILAIVSVPIISLIVRWVNSFRPSKKIREVFDLLEDTRSLLDSCSEEGLLQGEQAGDYETQLKSLNSRAKIAHMDTSQAKNIFQDVTNMFKGLTWDIYRICQDVKGVRSNISTSSMRERERLAAANAARASSSGNSPEADTHVEASCTPPTPAETPGDRPMEDTLATTLLTNTPPSTTATDTRVLSPPQITSRDEPSSHETSPAAPPPPPQVQPSTDVVALPVKSHVSPDTELLPWRKPLTTADRRQSVSSQSSTASSTRNLRWKTGGTPVSRVRVMKRFLRKARVSRTTGSVGHYVNLRLCEEKVVDDSDQSEDESGEWVYEGLVAAA